MEGREKDKWRLADNTEREEGERKEREKPIETRRQTDGQTDKCGDPGVYICSHFGRGFERGRSQVVTSIGMTLVTPSANPDSSTPDPAK